MRSNIYKIDRGGFGLSTIVREAGKWAELARLDTRQSLELRLLTEEVFEMLTKLICAYQGCLWFESDDNSYQLRATVASDIGIDPSGKAITPPDPQKSTVKGMMGKIKSVADGMLLQMATPGASAAMPDCSSSFYMAMACRNNVWTLSGYINEIKAALKRNQGKEEWDELEKSLIVKLADDVTVEKKNHYVEITVKKIFG